MCRDLLGRTFFFFLNVVFFYFPRFFKVVEIPNSIQKLPMWKIRRGGGNMSLKINLLGLVQRNL